jgi:hypothetical protein
LTNCCPLTESEHSPGFTKGLKLCRCSVVVKYQPTLISSCRLAALSRTVHVGPKQNPTIDLFRADGSLLLRDVAKPPSKPIRSSIKAFSEQESSTPPLPNGQERAVVIAKTLSTSHARHRHRHSQATFFADWLEATSAATVKYTNTVSRACSITVPLLDPEEIGVPSWPACVFISESQNSSGRDEYSGVKPKIHGLFGNSGRTFWAWFAVHCRTPSVLTPVARRVERLHGVEMVLE